MEVMNERGLETHMYRYGTIIVRRWI
jgi:hypothetical protein